MKPINYKLTACIALAFISLEVYAAGPDFTSDISISSFNPSIEFTDTTSGEADWSLCVDNDSRCNMGTPYESFALSSNDEGIKKIPFRIDINARTNALRLNGNNVGMGTATPAQELHIFSPTRTVSTPIGPIVVPGNASIRLESEKFGVPNKLWDIHGGASLFSIGDASAGTTPFVISGADGNIGIGAFTPEAAIHVKRTSTASIPDLFELTNAGDVRFKFKDTVADGFWRMSVENSANQFVITRSGTGAPELKLTNTGDLSIRGGLTANVGTTDDTFPDYVFEKDYPLMSLSKLESFIAKNKHLPNIPSKADVKAKGGQLNMTDMQLKLLEKVEELTLYTLSLNKENKKHQIQNKGLKQRLTQLEKQLALPVVHK